MHPTLNATYRRSALRNQPDAVWLWGMSTTAPLLPSGRVRAVPAAASPTGEAPAKGTLP
jgi:hypothetical protein